MDKIVAVCFMHYISRVNQWTFGLLLSFWSELKWVASFPQSLSPHTLENCL